MLPFPCKLKSLATLLLALSKMTMNIKMRKGFMCADWRSSITLGILIPVLIGCKQSVPPAFSLQEGTYEQQQSVD